MTNATSILFRAITRVVALLAVISIAFKIHAFSGDTPTFSGDTPTFSGDTPTFSGDTPKVVLVRLNACCQNVAWPTLEQRIEKELSFSGITVSSIEAADEMSLDEMLDTAMVESGADGAIFATVDSSNAVRLTLRFSMPDTDRALQRTVLLSTTSNEGAVEVTAIKAQEAVMAALYEQRQSSSPSAGEDAVSPKPQDGTNAGTSSAQQQPTEKTDAAFSTPTLHRRWHLRAGFGGAFAPGGLGSMGIVDGSVAFGIRSFAVGISGAFSVLTKKIVADTASASHRIALGSLLFAFVPRRLGRFLSMAGIRLGVGHVWSEGTSETHDVTTSRTTLFYGAIFAEGALVLSEHMSIPVSLGVGVLPPGVAVRFARENMATLKVLLVDATVGIAVTL